MSEQQAPGTPGNGQDDVTHFGFRDVPKSQKASQVAQVFHSVAGKYDLMNDLMSMGIHRLWKRFTIELSGVRPGHQVLDIAGGTGDLTMKFSDLVGPSGKVVLADINASMLQVGRSRLTDRGYAGNIEYVQADAEHLPFPDNNFQAVSIAFGLRNVTDKDQALRDMARVLKPGGKLMAEFGDGQESAIEGLFAQAAWASVEITNDLTGRPRIVIASAGQ
ncbi:ubiquinone/menaquinone biosynthesis methyltransferase [uncultured Marinobacter sp.]|uniref:ubiquinone/menaquinone biosynthesis methyltransferase n=1 Tax=uncultured Marinobacter sp. TaxID=187379 RepID=UPI0025839240|nr:ubiquinone/menaquinone biosynthesis methyltransferase [uncultured Marinobacter sp.]